MALERSSSPPHKAAVVAVISRRTIVKIDSARVWWSLGLELFNLELSQVCVCRGNYVVGLKLFMLESSRPRSASGNLCSTELDSSLFKYWLTGLLTGSLQSSATVYPHSTQPRTIYRSFAPTAAAATALSPSSPSSHPAAAFVHTGTRTNPCALHWYRRTQGSGTTPQSTSSPAPPQSHPVRSLPQSIAFDPPLQPTVAHSIDASKYLGPATHRRITALLTLAGELRILSRPDSAETPRINQSPSGPSPPNPTHTDAVDVQYCNTYSGVGDIPGTLVYIDDDA
ncbi:hypothetical protein C8R46DRAFT_1228587 [Mycena filopes]|nr:hypothetical protein C8R46DRAFT_1228587 [Mycena filopes]